MLARYDWVGRGDMSDRSDRWAGMDIYLGANIDKRAGELFSEDYFFTFGCVC